MKLDEGTGSKAYFLYSLVCYILYYLFFQNNVIGSGLGLVAALLLVWGVVALVKEIRAHRVKDVYSFNFFSRIKGSNDKQKMIITVWIIASIWWGASIANNSYDSSAAIIDIPFMFIVLGLPTYILFKLWSNKENK